MFIQFIVLGIGFFGFARYSQIVGFISTEIKTETNKSFEDSFKKRTGKRSLMNFAKQTFENSGKKNPSNTLVEYFQEIGTF